MSKDDTDEALQEYFHKAHQKGFSAGHKAGAKQERKEIVELIAKKYLKAKCSWCSKKATTQTVKGRENVVSGGLPQNDGFYCEKCFQKGLEIENEAIYG